MVEKIINEVTVRLCDRIPVEYISIMRDVISITLNSYEITEKSQDSDDVVETECIDIYLATRKIEGKSEKTIALYKLYLNEFIKMVRKPLKSITANDIRMYLYRVQEARKISNRTLDSRRTIVCTFMSWCASEGYISKNPAMNITPIKYERKERVPLTDIQLESVRKTCNDVRETAMIELLYSSGCRVTELERLNISDVNFETREVKLYGKGDKHRTSYLSAKAVVALQAYLSTRNDECEALFATQRSPVHRLTKQGIEAVIKKLGNRCGIPHLHPHLFRHTVATDCINRGMDVSCLQKMLGHSNLETTMIYAKVNDNSVKINHGKYIA